MSVLRPSKTAMSDMGSYRDFEHERLDALVVHQATTYAARHLDALIRRPVGDRLSDTCSAAPPLS